MSGLGSIGAWAWRRYGEEFQRAQTENKLRDHLMARGKANAFEEMAKYVETVQQAREDHVGKA